MAIDFISQQIANFNNPVLTQVAVALDFLTYPILLAIWLALLWKGWSPKKIGALMIGAIILMLLVQGAKTLTAQPRPCETLPAKTDCPTDNSFPSGHAAFTALFIPVFMGTPLMLPYFIFYLVVSASRIYLGVHVLSDVTFGTVLGIVSFLIALKLAGGIYGNDRNKK